MYQQVIRNFLSSHHFSRVQPLAALIDMDGTLYDSMPNHARAWHRMVTELGIPSREEEYFEVEGATGSQVINMLFERTYGHGATDEEVKEYYTRKTRYFRELPPPEPMPGARDMLDTLMRSGIRRVLVTGSGQSSLISRLDTDFPGAFDSDMRVTAFDVEHGKPHPEPFIRAMQKARVKPSQAIAIDNAPLGVESAAQAGVFTIGVVTGPLKEQMLIDAGATIVFPSMPEFARQLPMLLLQLLTTSTDPTL